MELLFTVDQAAERLQLQPATVRDQLKRGVLRGIKRGRVWRVPESALTEQSASVRTSSFREEAIRLWALLCDIKTHNRAVLEIAQASVEVQEIIDRQSTQVAEEYYFTPEGESELADWRALDGELFSSPGEEG